VTRSRRDLLKALAALGPLACVGRARGRTIAGSIVGGDHGRGHLLREGVRTRPARREEAEVVIAGAGVAGLSAAWTLDRAGLRDFVVLELEDAPGGTARSDAGPVTPYPWGAHYVPAPSADNRALLALLDEVGAVTGRDARGRPEFAEEVLCREPQERLFFKGEWYEGLYPRAGAGRDDLAQLAAFEAEMRRWAGWRDRRGRRAFRVPRAGCADAPELRALDRLSMADYLASRGWTSRRLRWFVEYACRDDFGATLSQTSAWAGVHYFAARMEDTTGETSEFLTWPEGNGRLVAHLARLAGPRLRLGALVTSVEPGAGAVDVTYLDASTGEGVGLRAAQVILALPAFLAARVLAPWRAAPPAHVAASEYGSWMVANLTLHDRPASRGVDLAWDNVLYESDSLGYVVATHQSGRDHGATVFTYYLPLTDDDARRARTRLLETTWEEWAARIVADLAPAHPGLDRLIDRIDVYLWGHAMVRPRPGLLWSPALAAARPVERVHFAHTDLSGMALFEEAQYWGVRTAEAILRTRGRSFRSLLV
jgi:glycine/D-amino acid oxidase-like deaminating enzyme